MELAKRIHKPIIVHSRDAAQDTYEMMKAAQADKIGGVVHCFSYSKEVAKQFVDMGFFLGVGGVVTFKNSKKLKEVVEYIPLEHLVLETDCPYMAPTPFRGKRNSSLYLPYVVEMISEIKGISTEEVEKVTWDNAHRLYRL
jgi:TatD DNase family protein